MLVHQIIAEQTINFRSVDILKQIPDGTTVERPARNLSGRPTTITLTKNGNVWEPNASGTITGCLLYTSPSPRDRTRSRMPSSA